MIDHSIYLYICCTSAFGFTIIYGENYVFFVLFTYGLMDGQTQLLIEMRGRI
jgi:hypothetical protein